jgi:hypothetical protein
MASFQVSCSFTFHKFAWSVMEKAFHKPPQALTREHVSCYLNQNVKIYLNKIYEQKYSY